MEINLFNRNKISSRENFTKNFFIEGSAINRGWTS